MSGTMTRQIPTTLKPLKIKSILRSPSLSTPSRRTGDEAGLDKDATPQSSKRRKVVINESINTTHVMGSKTPGQIRLEVRRALEDHIKGTTHAAYDTIKEMFAHDKWQQKATSLDEDDDEDTEDQEKSEDLQPYILGLSAEIETVKHKSCNGLVKVVLCCSWTGRDAAFARAYTDFLVTLVCAQDDYFESVVASLVEKFTLMTPTTWRVSGYPLVMRDDMRDRIHTALRRLLPVHPDSSKKLREILNKMFPYPDDSKKVHMAFVNNLLRVREYAPAEIKSYVLDLIVHRLVKIDVQMQTDLEDIEDEVGAHVATLVNRSQTAQGWEDDADDDADDSDDESVASDGSDAYDEEARRIKAVKGSVEKMDAMLDTLFSLLAPHFQDPDSDEALEYYAILMEQFRRFLLPTCKSRHIQFLLFHFGQRSERLLDAFVGTCASVAFTPTESNVLRQAATLYLSSFVARAARLDGQLVQSIFVTLLHHLDEYCKKYDTHECRGPDLKRYYAYYALFQGIIYIFCFRWQDFVVSFPSVVDPDDPASYAGHELEWMHGIKQVLLASIHSRMNPLKVCSPVIVEQFAKLAHRLNFMYIYPRIHANRRIRLSQFIFNSYGINGVLRDTGCSALDESSYQLDPYFPFDPYQLPVSKRWIEGDYVHWKAIPGLNSDDDEEGDEGRSEDCGEDDEEEDEPLAEEEPVASGGGDAEW